MQRRKKLGAENEGLNSQEEQDDREDDQCESCGNPEHFESVPDVVVHVFHIVVSRFENEWLA